MERGTRQGGCLSTTLYALCTDPLAQTIRQNEDLRGVNIGENENILLVFLRMMLLFFWKKTDFSFPMRMNLLETYGHYSGYKLNVSKTQILSLNYSPSRQIRDAYNLPWNVKSIRYRSVTINKTLSN